MLLESILYGLQLRRVRRGANRERAGRRARFETLEDRSLLSLTPAMTYPVGIAPQAVVAAHFNDDVHLDLAVANVGSSSVSVLLGNGNGTFQTALTSAAGANPISIAVGDFNEDGTMDLATANAGTSGVSVMLGNGNGTFEAPANINIGSDPASVAIGDFNGDGKMDLGVTSNTYTYPGYGYYYYGSYNGNANVLLGNGDGSFSPPKVTPLGFGYYTSAAAANFNGDTSTTGHPIDDFAVVNQYYGTVSVSLGHASGYLQSQAEISVGYYPWSVAAADLDGDLDADLVTANRYGNDVSVLLGNGVGGFAAPKSYAVGAEPTSVVIGDFNDDLKPDVATANFSGSEISVLYGRVGGALSVPVNAASPGAYSLAAGDFNGDGWLDAATANPSTNNVSVLINDQTWPPAPASLTIGDVIVTEGNAGNVAAQFTVTRSGDNLGATVTVNYSAANGAALAGSDYVAANGTLTFGPNETVKTIAILVNGDVTDEYDQSFYVNLSTASAGAVIIDALGIGTILDDDLPPTVSITPMVSGKEGNGNQSTLFNFIVTLSAPSEKNVSVNFATADGTATTADSDYVARSGSLIFAPGQVSKVISVSVWRDNKREPDETFVINLTSATDATIAIDQGVGKILDDDTPGGKGKPGKGT